jgi:hypothetical protein
MTQFSAYALYVVAMLYAALAVYVLLGGSVRMVNRQRARPLWYLILPTAFLVTFWFCGRWIWTIAFWIFVFGDAGPYEEYGRWVAAIVAVFVTVSLVVRLSLGLFSRRFLVVCVTGTALLTALSGVIVMTEIASRIDGWSARAAAENYLAKFRPEDHPFCQPNAEKRIVEENVPLSEPYPKPVRRFVLYCGAAPIRHVDVAPYGWWWTFARSGPAYQVNDLDWAVEHWDTDREGATEKLQAIIRNYPHSEASRWAAETLQTLQKQGSEGVPTWRAEMIKKLRDEGNRRKKGTQP